MAQKHGFLIFYENYVISFIWNLCKMKVLLGHQHSAKTACLGKIWFSSYSQKWLSANEISVLFNCQYFTNKLISDFDFWHVDRHEWKEQCSLTGFLKKISFGQMYHFRPENGTSSQLLVISRKFLKFCRMKWVNRYINILLVVFREKNSFGEIWSF